jgi:hypothetical protein
MGRALGTGPSVARTASSGAAWRVMGKGGFAGSLRRRDWAAKPSMARRAGRQGRDRSNRPNRISRGSRRITAQLLILPVRGTAGSRVETAPAPPALRNNGAAERSTKPKRYNTSRSPGSARPLRASPPAFVSFHGRSPPHALSPCGRGWPREARSGEGSLRPQHRLRRSGRVKASMFESPLIRRPSAATFSREGRRIRRVKILPLWGRWPGGPEGVRRQAAATPAA